MPKNLPPALTHRVKRAFTLACTVAFCACATVPPTPYAPQVNGYGHWERHITPNVSFVAFAGNPRTTGDMVWNYWMYRAAELTVERGYTAFAVRRDPPPSSWLGSPSMRHAVHGIETDTANSDEGFRMVPTKGASVPIYVPIYTVAPSTTVKVYSMKNYVLMLKKPYPVEAGLVLEASKVMERLKPYVTTAGKESAPERKQLLVETAAFAVPINLPPN
jgi:hypothetical protein